MTDLTPEQQIAKDYAACIDSVNLINGAKPEKMTDEEWAGTVARNKEHLATMLAKNCWTTEDLSPLHEAVK